MTDNLPTVNDWMVINKIVDEALDKVLEFLDAMGIDNQKVPSSAYLNMRLARQRARRHTRGDTV